MPTLRSRHQARNSFADASNPWTPIIAMSGFPNFNELVGMYGWDSEVAAKFLSALPGSQFNMDAFKYAQNMADWAAHYYELSVEQFNNPKPKSPKPAQKTCNVDTDSTCAAHFEPDLTGFA